MEKRIAEILSYPLDLAFLRKKQTAIRRELIERDITWIDKKIAILGGSTTAMFRDLLEIFLLADGIRPAFYESEYGKYYEDAVFSNAELDAFAPDVVFIFTSHVNLHEELSPNAAEKEAEAHINRIYKQYEAMWEALAERHHAIILQNNFDLPPHRSLGSLDAALPSGLFALVEGLNIRFAAYAQSHASFHLHDIHYLSASVGLDHWFDHMAYAAYKLAISYDAMPYAALHAANVIKAIFGRTRKCLVLDLDNTLWGGVIGDAGVSGIRIGKELPEAESFTSFQQYVLALKRRGVLLAVCSKNDENVAREGLRHPDSVLKEDDFVAFYANWESKDANLRRIAETLNIGLDSIVFIDDSPSERELVRAALPMVAVPEVVGGNTMSYMRAIERNGYFETIAVSTDDAYRSVQYQENRAREALAESAVSYEDFLTSLEMEAEIAPFVPLYYDRIAQLTNKTNQFNLTTVRLSHADIERMASDTSYVTLYGRLKDRLGDNGLVSVLIARRDGVTLDIELWLMSCRVLKRGMEDAMLDALIARARDIGIEELRGTYIPTAKNAMTADLYPAHGFEKIEEQNGATRWRLVLSREIPAYNAFIRVHSPTI